VERCYYDWQQMLQDGGFDAVSICTPPVLHSEMAIESARRSYHVLVEKPMALTLEQCDWMIEAAAKAGVLLMVAHNQRFMAHHRQAKQLLQLGRLGQPYVAHAVFGHGGPEHWSPTQEWYFQPDLAGPGALADLGSHKIDLLRWLLDQEVVEVGAIAATFEKATTVNDTAICLLRFDQGTLATIQASWVFRPDWENSLTIRGERGVLRISTEVAEPLRLLATQKAGSGEELYCDPTDPAGWLATVAAFVQAINNGDVSPVPGEEGRATMKVVLAADEALKRKTVIQLS
jgi:UDP-N-acetylglucosamine 3-dehydrogenase